MTLNRAIIDELEKDLRLSPTGKVLYLEGHTDVPVFLGLVGYPLPETIESEGLAVEGIWIRGLGARRGSGGSAVRHRVRVAHERGYGPIRGLIDGDGEPYDALISGFETPGAGEPHPWPTYCIENWLPQGGWPPEWGDEPRWSEYSMPTCPTPRSTESWLACSNTWRRPEWPSMRTLFRDHSKRRRRFGRGSAALSQRQWQAPIS
jgi:hypothetical protein